MWVPDLLIPLPLPIIATCFSAFPCLGLPPVTHPASVEVQVLPRKSCGGSPPATSCLWPQVGAPEEPHMGEGQNLGPYHAGWLSPPLLVGGRARQAPGRGLTERCPGNVCQWCLPGAVLGRPELQLPWKLFLRLHRAEPQPPSLDPESQQPYSPASHLDSQCHPQTNGSGRCSHLRDPPADSDLQLLNV